MERRGAFIWHLWMRFALTPSPSSSLISSESISSLSLSLSLLSLCYLYVSTYNYMYISLCASAMRSGSLVTRSRHQCMRLVALPNGPGRTKTLSRALTATRKKTHSGKGSSRIRRELHGYDNRGSEAAPLLYKWVVRAGPDPTWCGIGSERCIVSVIRTAARVLDTAASATRAGRQRDHDCATEALRNGADVATDRSSKSIATRMDATRASGQGWPHAAARSAHKSASALSCRTPPQPVWQRNDRQRCADPTPLAAADRHRGTSDDGQYGMTRSVGNDTCRIEDGRFMTT